MIPPRDLRGGFSSLEGVTILALLAVATLGLVGSLVAGQGSLRHIEDDSQTLHQAQILMSRLTTIPFGAPTDATPSWTTVAAIVTIENDLFGAPTGGHDVESPQQYYTGTALTLSQLAKLPMPLTWSYANAGRTFNGNAGTWGLIVDRDLNGDGDLSDPIETATQLSQGLLRIELQFQGRRVLRTIRSQDPVQ